MTEKTLIQLADYKLRCQMPDCRHKLRDEIPAEATRVLRTCRNCGVCYEITAGTYNPRYEVVD